MRSAIAEAARREEADGVPADLARRIAVLPVMPAATDLVRLAAATGAPVDTVAALYFAVGEAFGFAWLRQQAESIPAPGYWQRLAIAALIDELYEHQRRLVDGVLAVDGDTPEAAIATWTTTGRATAVERARVVLGELQAASSVDLSMLAVASRQLRTLTEG